MFRCLLEGMLSLVCRASFVREITSLRCIPVTNQPGAITTVCYCNPVVQRKARTPWETKRARGACGFWTTRIVEPTLFLFCFPLSQLRNRTDVRSIRCRWCRLQDSDPALVFGVRVLSFNTRWLENLDGQPAMGFGGHPMTLCQGRDNRTVQVVCCKGYNIDRYLNTGQLTTAWRETKEPRSLRPGGVLPQKESSPTLQCSASRNTQDPNPYQFPIRLVLARLVAQCRHAPCVVRRGRHEHRSSTLNPISELCATQPPDSSP